MDTSGGGDPACRYSYCSNLFLVTIVTKTADFLLADRDKGIRLCRESASGAEQTDWREVGIGNFVYLLRRTSTLR